MTRFVLLLLRVYQRTLSPDHGWFRAQYPYGFCRYSPSCSQYAIEAFERFGFFRGAALTSWRLFRCNPYARGGSDPVRGKPQRHERGLLPHRFSPHTPDGADAAPGGSA